MAENTNTERDYPELPQGWPARFRCDSCDGNGEVGDPISMGYFQPPERERCPDCDGKGWCSEEVAFSADHMCSYVDADRKARASLPLPAAGQEPMFWVRLCGDGLYEGPLHNNSFGGKLARKERPGEWSPLYLGAAPQPAVAAGWVRLPASVVESAITALDWMPTSDATRHLWDRQQPVLALLRSSIPPAPSTEGESNADQA